MPLPTSGSRRAAISGCEGRDGAGQTVKEPDRCFAHAAGVDQAFLTRCHTPQQPAVPCAKARYRSRTEEARGSNPLISTPQTDPIVEVPTEIHQALVPRHAVRFRSDLLSQLAASSRPVSRGGRSTSPPHSAATPATLPDPLATLGISLG
jgi:hypothetical protein